MSKTNVMPFQIKVVYSHPLDQMFPQYYSKDGVPLFPMTCSNMDIRKHAYPFDNDIFCGAMSIQSEKDAEQFVHLHPSLRFLFFDHPGVPKYALRKYASSADYYSSIVAAVSQFNDFRDFIDLRERYTHSRSFEDRESMLQIYKKYFHVLHTSSSNYDYSEMYDFYWSLNSRIDEVTEKAIDEGKCIDTDAAYQELIEDYFEGKDSLRADYYRTVCQKTDSAIDQVMFEDIKIYISCITNAANFFYDPSESAIIYQCPSILSAMYMMTFVSAFNQDEYRECAHKNCHQFFKVDKSHPQTMCDKHMASRRKKRQNQRKYAKDELSYNS